MLTQEGVPVDTPSRCLLCLPYVLSYVPTVATDDVLSLVDDEVRLTTISVTLRSRFSTAFPLWGMTWSHCRTTMPWTGPANSGFLWRMAAVTDLMWIPANCHKPPVPFFFTAWIHIPTALLCMTAPRWTRWWRNMVQARAGILRDIPWRMTAWRTF